MSDNGRGEDRRLLDLRALMAEYDLRRAAAEALMRQLPKVTIEGLRKVYVRRRDVDAYFDSRATVGR